MLNMTTPSSFLLHVNIAKINELNWYSGCLIYAYDSALNLIRIYVGTQ
jgi:hypothetical protein